MVLEYFPYRPRAHQSEAVEAIREAAEKGISFCLHAPTGFGKTPVVLAALLPVIEGMDGSIIWAVRTGNETDRPIEELKVINEHREVFGLSFRGKRDMCLLAREKGIASYEGVSTLCRMKRNTCPYHKNLRRMKEVPIPNKPMTFSEIFELAKGLKICPYFLQILLLEYSHVISLSYNYILSPLGWVIRHKVPFRHSILVVDEAHNIHSAAMEMNSKHITLTSVRRALQEIERYDPDDELGLREKIISLAEFMSRIAVSEDGIYDIDQLLEETGIRPDDIREIYGLADLVYRDQMKRGREPRSYLNSLGDFLVVALEKKGEEGVAYIYTKEEGKIKLEVWDMRARDLLSRIWDDFHSVVFMSGTLEPIEAFAETTGVEEYGRMTIPSMADPERVRSLMVRGVSTKGEKLTDEMIRRYLKVLDAFLSLSGNLAIFTASYRVQEEIIGGIKELADRHGRILFIERRNMLGDEASKILRDFKSLPSKREEGLLVAPAGGRFAEGADFPGEELNGVFLLGIPFDRLTTKTKLYIEYNQRVYGKRRGRYLAYVVPALRRASQAMGRVIRSEEDEGIFVLGDERYMKPTYFKLLPDFVKYNIKIARWDEINPPY